MEETGSATPHPSRFPLPTLLFAVVVVLVAHGPLLKAPPILAEGALLSRDAELVGWLPGSLLLGYETRIWGDWLPGYRGTAVGLELLGLLGLAFALRGRVRNPGAGLLLLAAYWIHPMRTEAVVQLAMRPVLVSELLAVAGMAVAVRGVATWAGPLSAALCLAAATGMPALAALAVPGLLAPGRRLVAPALGFLVGAAAPLFAGSWSLEGSSAPLFEVAGIGARDVLAPTEIGLVELPVGPLWVTAFVVAGVVIVALAGAWRRATGGCLLAALLALEAAVVLRPARPDLARLGGGITPEVFAPGLLLVFLACFAMTQRRGWRGLFAPLLMLAVLPASVLRARDFDDEATFIAEALERAPDHMPLHVLAGDCALRGIEGRPGAEWYAAAERALRHAEFALRTGGGTEARVLRTYALSYLGKTGEARREAESLLDEDPSDWRRMLLRGDAERLDDRRLEALRWFRAARNSRQEDGPAAVLKSRYEHALASCYDRIEAAIDDQDSATARQRAAALLKVAPEERRAAELSAHTYILEGDPGGALTAFEAVHSRFPQSLVALKALVGLYEAAGHDETAQRYRAELLRLGGMSAFE